MDKLSYIPKHKLWQDKWIHWLLCVLPNAAMSALYTVSWLNDWTDIHRPCSGVKIRRGSHFHIQSADSADS